MHPLTIFIAISTVVLANPIPLPLLAGDISDTILDSVSGIFGTSNRHGAKCNPRSSSQLQMCIHKYVDQCIVDSTGYDAYMRACAPKNRCGAERQASEKSSNKPISREDTSSSDDSDS
ncbi:uncharacterized protein F4822DRAFT_433840 [Hypoxylon trugodes]|uniref:uncharacterized protein n=1 Tax=Hypoxylon trugodes TaxID=326681 RepID=UPI0021944A71|nr:uncharacterized protein F4822DRAFT_433840 [Hypoxylon trugodes]KAI1383891.1 hypothetical protein F4822DRAFT_433840 [Hypoxylon trugodes]